MFKREELIRRMNEGLTAIELQIRNQNLLTMYDCNKSAEGFYAGLLNLIFDWNLKVAEKNQPGYDLIDEKNRIILQISAQNSSDKIKHTLEAVEKCQLASTYDLYFFFINGKKRSYNVEFKVPNNIVFSKETHILDNEDILVKSTDSQVVSTERLQDIQDYLDKEFKLWSISSSADINRNELSFDQYLEYIPIRRQDNVKAFGYFRYDSGFTEMIGRNTDLTELIKFAEDDRQILWWALTGPAGTGKSRMAWETVKTIDEKEDWVARFLTWRTFYEQFKSNYPTIIGMQKNVFVVIDYVCTYEREIGEFIQWLSQSKGNTDTLRKIRVLLIEREGQHMRLGGVGLTGNPNWMKSLKRGFSSWTEFTLYQYDEALLHLYPKVFTEDEKKSIVRSFLMHRKSEVNEPEIDIIVGRANSRFHDQPTPLMLQVMAEASLFNYDNVEKRRSVNSILEQMVIREIDAMSRTLSLSEGVESYIFQEIMLIATILADVDVFRDRELIEALVGHEKTSIISDIFDRIIKSSMIYLGEDGKIRFSGVQPDIIGESYVLMLLRNYTEEKRLDLLKLLLHEREAQTFRFLFRLANDFSEDIAEMRLLLDLDLNFSGMFTAIDQNGLEVLCQTLFTFSSEETKRDYIVYTDNSLDENGDIRTYASIYHSDNPALGIEPVETDSEWKMIEIILNTIQDEAENNGSNIDADSIAERVDEKMWL